MRILALTFGDVECASSYYRIYQFIEPLKELGIFIEAYPANSFENWDSLSEYEAVIVQKKLFSTGKARLIKSRSRKLIYDIDDAIWEPHGKKHHWFTQWRTNRRLDKIVSNADLCIAANNFIANHLSKFNKNVEIVPMSLPAKEWSCKDNLLKSSGIITIGWSGSPSNLPFLTAIEQPLYIIQQKFPSVEYVVFSGARPRLIQLIIKYIPYAKEKEAEIIRSFDIGLLPLDTSPFANGKSPIKGLQYSACGLAVVCTPTAGVTEIFEENKTALFARDHQEWVECLTRLIQEPSLRLSLAKRAREVFEQKFTLEKNIYRLSEMLKSV